MRSAAAHLGVLLIACLACGPDVESGNEGAETMVDPGSSGSPDDNTADPIVKGMLDEAALVSGVTVQLSADGSIGEVEVPLARPLPSVDVEALEAELLSAVSCGVVSQETGVATDLAAGTLGRMLSMAGAWTWAIDDARDVVTIRFVNETPSGLVLARGRVYSVTLSVTTNAYIERVSAFTFSVTIQ